MCSDIVVLDGLEIWMWMWLMRFCLKLRMCVLLGEVSMVIGDICLVMWIGGFVGVISVCGLWVCMFIGS